MERLEHLEQRVDKLEDNQKMLAVLPAQLEMLIQIQNENTSALKEMAKHLEKNYVSERVCQERCGNLKTFHQENKDFRKWVYMSLISAAFIIIIELLRFMGRR